MYIILTISSYPNILAWNKTAFSHLKFYSSERLHSSLIATVSAESSPPTAPLTNWGAEATGPWTSVTWFSVPDKQCHGMSEAMSLALIFKIMAKITPTTSHEQDHSDRQSRSHLSNIWKHTASKQNTSGRRVGGSTGEHGRGKMTKREHVHNKCTVCNKTKNLKVTMSLLERLFGTMSLFQFCLMGTKDSRVCEYRKQEKQDENQEESSNFVSLWVYYLKHVSFQFPPTWILVSCFSMIFHLSFRAKREEERKKVGLYQVIY